MPFGWAQGRLRLRFTAQTLRLRSGRQCRDRRLLMGSGIRPVGSAGRACVSSVGAIMGARASRPHPFVLSQIRCGRGQTPRRQRSLCQFGRRHHGSAGVSPASIRPVPNPLWREPVERKLPTEPPTNLGHHPTNQHIPQSPPIPKITVQTTPLAPLVDNPRHSNRPPVIPAKAGIQRGGDVGNPTNHKNHTNVLMSRLREGRANTAHSSDNPLRAP